MTAGAHVSFREKHEPEFTGDADYVIVGSGAGGAAAALILARSGASVAIVEAGPWRDPTDYPHSAYGGMRDLIDDWGAQFTRGRGLWPVVQARVMGGTTVINSAICVRTPDDIFDNWEKNLGLTGHRERVRAHQERLEKELSVETVPVASRGQSNVLAQAGFEKLKWPQGDFMRRYVKGCEGSGQCLQGCTRLRKQSTNITFIPEVQQRGGLIVSAAPVEKVVLKGNRATGVTGRFVHPGTRRHGACFTVHARKAVLIAASVTHSPVLLFASGITPPALGNDFRSHPGTGIFGVYKDVVDMNVGTTQGWASIAFRETPGFKVETLAIPPDLVASRLAGGGTELMKRLGEYRHLAMWAVAVRADTRGTVRRSMFTGKPVIHYTLDPTDMAKLRAGLVAISKQHFAAGAQAIVPGVAGLPYTLTADTLHILENASLDPRNYIGVLSHLFGGCVMGKDPKTSVVDAHGRVHGIEGLVVADASVIPTNLGVNPQHTIMALASIFAEDLLGS